MDLRRDSMDKEGEKKKKCRVEWEWWSGVVVVLGIAVGAYFLLKLPVLAFDSFADSTFYLAYSRSFTELVLRHGFLYYATRFGAIFPDTMSFWVFGEIAGVLVLRWGLFLFSSLALYALFAKRGGAVVGCLVAVAWVFHPAVARLLVTTYLDSIAVPVLLVAICVWSMGRIGSLLAFGVGVLLALVLSSHLYLIVMTAFLLPFVIGARWEERGKLVAEGMWVGMGAGLTFLVAVAYYGFVWRMPDIWSPTVELMREMAAGDAQKWQKPFWKAVEETPAWFAPFALIAVLVLGGVRGGAMWVGALVALVSSTSFFWLGDLLGGAYALSMPFYYSFLLPVQILAWGAVLVKVLGEEREGRKFWILVGGVLAVSVWPSWVAAMIALPTDGFWGWVIVGAAVGVVGFFGRVHRLAILAILAFGVVQNLGVCTPGFVQFYGSYRREHPKEERVLGLAAKLRNVLPSAGRAGKVLRFWTSEDPGQDVRLVQWFFLYQFSRLGGEGGRAASYPHLTEGDVKALRSAGIGTIVVLDRSEAKMREAMGALAGIGFEEMQSGVVRFRGREIFYGYGDLKEPEVLGGEELSMGGWEASGDSAVSRITSGVSLRTGKKKWMFDAKYPLGEKKGEEAIRRVVLEGKIGVGRVTVSVLSQAHETLASVEWWETEGETRRVLEVPERKEPAFLVVRNMQPDGAYSELFLRKMWGER